MNMCSETYTVTSNAIKKASYTCKVVHNFLFFTFDLLCLLLKNEITFLWILKQSQTTFSFVAVRVMASDFFFVRTPSSMDDGLLFIYKL